LCAQWNEDADFTGDPYLCSAPHALALKPASAKSYPEFAAFRDKPDQVQDWHMLKVIP
jgi:hypothetical protein